MLVVELLQLEQWLVPQAIQNKLNYNLYTDNTYSKVWGQTAGTDTVDLTGDGTAQTSTVYGKLDLNQYVKADSYSDNLTVTINY